MGDRDRSRGGETVVLTAITRRVSASFAECEVTFQERQPIDVALAKQQHAAYEAALAELGARVISLPALPDHPDCVFVEDPILVLDEVAIVTRMGAESRRGESQTLADAVREYREVRTLEAPATLEGGDVMRIVAPQGFYWKNVSPAFFAQNHSKYHVAIDLHKPGGQDLVRRLPYRCRRRSSPAPTPRSRGCSVGCEGAGTSSASHLREGRRRQETSGHGARPAHSDRGPGPRASSRLRTSPCGSTRR